MGIAGLGLAGKSWGSCFPSADLAGLRNQREITTTTVTRVHATNEGLLGNAYVLPLAITHRIGTVWNDMPVMSLAKELLPPFLSYSLNSRLKRREERAPVHTLLRCS